MNLFKLAPIAAALAITTAPVVAEEVNGLVYNQAGIGYGNVKLSGTSDGVDLDGTLNGYGFSVQGVAAESFVLGLSYQKASGDIDASAGSQSISFDTDSTTTSFTVGYRFAVADGTDIVPLLQYTSSKLEVDGESDDGDSTVFGIRLNTRVSDMVQATLGFRTDGKDDEYGKTYDIGALIKVQQNVGIGISYTLNDTDVGDQKGWSVVVNYLF